MFFLSSFRRKLDMGKKKKKIFWDLGITIAQQWLEITAKTL